MKYYQTITDALTDLGLRGYTIDYNLRIVAEGEKTSSFSLAPEQFQITEVYRFEGETSSDDEAVVYAIESKAGQKGVFVNGYGISADTANDELIRRLQIRQQGPIKNML
jgi:hypothetical protein